MPISKKTPLRKPLPAPAPVSSLEGLNLGDSGSAEQTELFWKSMLSFKQAMCQNHSETKDVLKNED
jgi:hypothetical protein